jgi:CRP/FNR family transcriptional regulator
MGLTKEQYIKQLFPQFEPALKQVLIENSTIKSFALGEVLMETGQFFKSTMLIVDGKVKLYRQSEDGGEFFMYYLEAGNACALSMICAIKQESSEVMAKAVEPTVVLSIPIDLMDSLMRDYRTWYYFVMETYRSRFEELLMVIDSITFKALDERLIFYLKNQSEKLKTKQLNITHNEIANDLNSSREVISRLLKKMEQKGLLILHRNYLEILN